MKIKFTENVTVRHHVKALGLEGSEIRSGYLRGEVVELPKEMVERLTATAPDAFEVMEPKRGADAPKGGKK